MTVGKNLNIALMRIISMFLIVSGHVIGHYAPSITNGSSALPTDIPRLLIFLSFHVNLFVLISGYCGIRRIQSIWKTWKLIFSYLLLIALMNLVFSWGGFDYSCLLLPLSRNPWWFMHIYVLLALLAPTMLEPLLATVNHHQLSVLACVLIVIDVYFGFFCHMETVHYSGFNLIHFITIYIIGSCLRTLDVRHLSLKGHTLKAHHFLLMFALGMVLKVLYHFGTEGLGLNDMCNDYNHPFNIALAVCLFLSCINMNVRDTRILFVSNSVIGVYLLHEHPLIREWLIKEFDILAGLCKSNIPMELLLVLSYASAIFITAILIDKVRLQLLKSVECGIAWGLDKVKFHSGG